MEGERYLIQRQKFKKLHAEINAYYERENKEPPRLDVLYRKILAMKKKNKEDRLNLIRTYFVISGVALEMLTRDP